jgi:membrane-bound lytic murein transglycosylase D
MRKRPGKKVGVIGLSLLLGVTAWAVRGGEAPTEPPPVDLLLEEGVLDEAESTTFRSPMLRPRTAGTWDLTVTHNDRVQFWIDFLQGRNRDRTHVWLEREGMYGEFIRERLRSREMPEDLFYLAMIESGLSPRAYSRAHAAGIWQFIPATGRRFGLEISTYVDERRDPVKSTDAALDYLSFLYRKFGSWYLAAAAYNSGEGRVERILRQHAGGRTGEDRLYWQIARHLPQETRDYVPLMLAAGHIGKDPNAYGFFGLEHQAPLSFDRVEVPGGVTLASVAQVAGVPVERVRELNPHLVRGSTPPGRTWELRVPVGRRELVLANLERLAVEERAVAAVVAPARAAAPARTAAAPARTHRVARGETLSHIARRHGVTVVALQRANPNVNPRRLQVGQRITVPAASGARVASAAQPSWRTYQVRRGDTLTHIARRHGVSVRQIQQWNGIGTRIYAGQRLRIQA